MSLTIIPALHRATHAVALQLDRPPKLGISQAEAHILAELLSSGDQRVGELHETFGHKRSTLTAILDRLEARHLVARVVDRDDRRAFRVHLTAAGSRSAERARGRLAAIERDALRHLSAAERAALAKGLAALAR